MLPCYKFNAAATPDEPATLSIFDEIGFWGVQAKDFIRDLNAVTSKVLNVEINSPGGDVFAGLAIYNALKQSGKEIVVKVMGVAASAASLIMMAGDKRIMPKNTFTMVHNPWSFAMGNADELRETADTLDKIGSSLQATYVNATGQTPEKIAELLGKDTWLTADESLELGFATEVIDDVKANASFDMTRADLPANVRAVFMAAPKPKANEKTDPPAKVDPVEDDEDEEPVVEQIEALAKAAGLDETIVAYISLDCDTVAAAQTRIADAREILSLCRVAGRPDDAKAAIAAGKPVAEVRASLIKARAEADEHTDNTKKVDAKTTASSGPNPKTVWASHNAQKTSSKKGQK